MAPPLITEQHTMEDLNRAYVLAVAARSGYTVDGLLGRTHDYKVDGTFRQVQSIAGKISETGYSLDFQLKASTNWSLEDSHITYDLEVDAYNFLIRRNGVAAIPCLLIVFCMPPERELWLELSEEECNYFVSGIMPRPWRTLWRML